MRKPFENGKRQCFPFFVISSFVPEIFTILYYANQIADDVTNCSNMVSKHKMTNIAANNWVRHLNLDNNNVLQKIYHIVHILMLLWQHAWSQFSFRFESTIINCDSIKRNTSSCSKHVQFPNCIRLHYKGFERR